MNFVNSLNFLCKYYGINISQQTLFEDIYSSNNIVEFDIDIFREILKKKLLIKTKVVEIDIEKINSNYFPFLIINEELSYFIEEISNTECKITTINEEIQDVIINKKELINFFNKKELVSILLSKEERIPLNSMEINEFQRTQQWFINVIKSNIKIYAQVLIAAIFINIFVLASPLYVMNIYDRVIPNNATDTLIVLSTGIFIIYTFDLLLKTIRSWLIGFAGRKADAQIGRIIFNQLLNIKLESKPAYSGTFSNSLLGFESLREFFTSSTIALIIDLPFIILFVWVIFYIGGAMAIIPILTFIIGLTVAFLSQIPQRKYIRESFSYDQYKQGLLLETITGLETIKSTGLHSRMRFFWEKSINSLSHINEKNHFINNYITYIITYLTNISTIAIVVIGVYGVKGGEITMGAIIAASLLNGRINAPITQIVILFSRLERSLLYLKVINNLMEMPVEKSDMKTYLNRPNLNGNILLKNIDFQYKDTNIKVLTNIELTIKENEKVAIIGRIGSGKSTLAKLICNLYSPTEGSILINQTNISQIEPSDLRNAIGYMQQDNFLFMGSIRDNIISGSKINNDEALINAAKISNVIHFTNKHEKGFDLEIGERGDGLSGGEKQAVALARSLVNDPNILILDEPTSQMDFFNERLIINNLKEFTKNKTLIIITHKFSLLELVDRIIVIDNGKIIEDGSKELILKKLQSGKVVVNG